jgi:hypothetical protein
MRGLGVGLPGEECDGLQSRSPGCRAVEADIALERRRARLADARARREAEKARLATERSLAAEARLAAIESSVSWRVTWPLRRLAAAVPPPIYHAARRGPGRLLRAIRGEAKHPPPPRSASTPAEDDGGPVALLIDDHWPRPDRDSGSIDIVNLAEALLALGFSVHFAADRDHVAASPSPGRDALASRGICCLGLENASSVSAYLARDGGRLALVVLNRVYCGGRFMEEVRRHCGGARVVFNTLDLHYVRLRREAELGGDEAGLAAAEAVRDREETLVREADATLVVSRVERDLLTAAVPDANVVVLPLAREVRPPRAPFDSRSGVGFIGGFAHAPNVDAVRFFLTEVWPEVLRRRPGCEFSIVGEGLPPDLLEQAPGGVRYLGPLSDTGPWFESLRVSVAPLRYGAGLKGKVVSSLASGVPCVGTSIATEGMELRPGDGVVVAETPAELTDGILRVHDDPKFWSELSSGGVAFVADRCSPSRWRSTLEEALWLLDALPGGAAGNRR